MSDQTTGTTRPDVKNATYVFRMTFGNTISSPGKQLQELVLEQDAEKRVTADKSVNKETYSITLRGVKVNKKIYQPNEIDAELDFMEVGNDGITLKVPSIQAVTDLLLKRQVTVDFLHVSKAVDDSSKTVYGMKHNVGKNYYVYEVNPQLKRDTTGSKLYVKLSIFSMDKLMTIDKYSKAYVAKKLGSGILEREKMSFGKQADDVNALISTNIKGMQNLRYDEDIIINNETVSLPSEFIHPYLVQYNETFYDLLVRTTNRCGEFLFFEDGQLTIGLPHIMEEAVTISDFESVTFQSITPGPLLIEDYVRDSAKEVDKNGKVSMGELNHSVVDKNDKGYPNDIFPDTPKYNSELATDEYFVPLYKGKFTNLLREMCLNGGADKATIFKVMQVMKSTLASSQGTDNSLKGALTGLGVNLLASNSVSEVGMVFLSASTAIDKNKKQKAAFFDVLEGVEEQVKNDCVVQFGTYDTKGWTTLDYYHDIRQHEEAQQSKIICISLGTYYQPLRLGQKIKLEGQPQEYIVIQILQQSEQAWSRDYDTYGNTASDKFSGSRSLKVYAIPAYTEQEEGETQVKTKYIPPVQPVSVIRKAGPQTAFIVASNDPKFQGRVRIAYPWQSVGNLKKRQAEDAQQQLDEAKQDAENQIQLTAEQLKNVNLFKRLADNLLAYLKMTEEERKTEKERLEKEKADYQDKISTAEGKMTALQDEWNKTKNLMLSYVNEDQAEDRAQAEAKLVAIESEMEQEKQELDDLKEKLAEIERQLELYDEAVENEKEQKELYSHYSPEINRTYLEIYQDYEDASKGYQVSLKKQDEKEKALEKQQKAADAAYANLQAEIEGLASPWIRVSTPMATDGGGFHFKFRKGDEVLVNYDNDNIERPYVVGSLFSKNVLEPKENLNRYMSNVFQYGDDLTTSFMSPNGHHITFTDPDNGMKFIAGLNPGTGYLHTFGAVKNTLPDVKDAKDLTGGVHIGDRYGLYEIEMKSHSREIKINSPLGQIKLNAFTGITINAPNGDINLVGQNVSIKAGNKLELISGTNILPPDIGSPEMHWSQLWSKSKPTDKWYEQGGRWFPRPAHAVGHDVLLPAAAAGSAVGANKVPLADMTFFRCLLQTFMRPLDGTMLIKSKKYMLLEAGGGNAQVNPTRYNKKNSEKKTLAIDINKKLIESVTEINTRLDNFFKDYDDKYRKMSEAKSKYTNYASPLLNNDTDPNILEKAYAANVDAPSNPVTITAEMYEGKIVNDLPVAIGRKPQSFMVRLIDYANTYATTTFDLRKHINTYTSLFDDLKETEVEQIVGNILTATFESIRDELSDQWNEKYGLNGTPNDDFGALATPEVPSATDRTIFKRKMVATFLLNLAKNEETKDYFAFKFKESDINYKNLKQDYYWKRFIQNTNRGVDWEGKWHKKMGAVYNFFAQNNFLASTVESFFSTWKAQLKPDKWQLDVWSDEKGQILMSDHEDVTVHINSGSKQPTLEADQDANKYSEQRFMKLLMSIK